MNQRIHNLTKWKFVGDGESLHFPGNARTVILEVNCPGEVCFYVQQDPEIIHQDVERIEDDEAGRRRPGDDFREVAFIGLVKGRDRLEFGVSGSFDLIVEGGGAYIYTFDGQDTATRVVAPIVFTRLANRRARNPNLEMIEYRMKLNQQRFFAELEEEQIARLEAVKNELVSYLPERNPVAPPDLVGKTKVEDGVEERTAEEELVLDEPAAPVAKRKRAKSDDEDA